MAEIDGGALSFKSVMDNDQMNAAINETLRCVQGLSKGTVAGGKAMDSAFDATTENVRIQKNVIKDLEIEYSKLEKEIKKLAPGSGQIELIKQAKQAKQEIDAEKQSLTHLETAVNSNKQAQSKLTTQLRNITQELAKMEEAGLRGSDAYEKLQQEAGRLTNAMDDVRQQAKILAHDNAGLQGIISAVSGVVGAFSAAQGAISLFAGENENLQKIMVKVQSLMAITMGLQQVANTLNKDSYFSMVTLVKVKKLMATATNTLSVALGISNVSAQALMATLTLGLSLAITGAIYLWDKFSSAQKKAKEEQAEFSKSLIDAVSKPIGTIEMLSAKYAKLGDDMAAKQKFIEQNKKSFDELGVSISSVAEAENLLIKNKDRFVLAQIAKAKSAIYIKQSGDKIENLMIKQAEYDAIPDKRREWKGIGMDLRDIYEEVDNPAKKAKKKEIDDLTEEIKKGYKNAATEENNALFNLKKGGIASIKEYSAGTIAAIEQTISEKQAKLKELMPNSKEFTDTQKEIATLQKQLEGINEKKKTGTDNDFSRSLAEKKKSYQEYFNWVNAGYQQEAQVEFASLLANGKTYKDYLDKKRTELESYTKLTKVQQEQLYAVLNELANENKQTQIDAFNSTLSNQLNSTDLTILQLGKIKKLREDLKDDDPLKGEKEKLLNDAQANVLQKQKEETDALLDNYSEYLNRKIGRNLEFENQMASLRQRADKAETEDERTKIIGIIALYEQMHALNIENFEELEQINADSIYRLGSFEQKRLMIVKGYEKLIGAARIAGQEDVAKRLEGERDLEILRETQQYKEFFGDVSEVSLKTLENTRKALLSMMQAALKAGKITADEYKQLIDEINNKMDSASKTRGIEALFGNSKGGGVMNMMFGEGDFESKINSFKTIFKGSKEDMKGIADDSGKVAENAGEAAEGLEGAVGGAAGIIEMVYAAVTAVSQTINAVTGVMDSISAYKESMGEDTDALDEFAVSLKAINDGLMGTVESLKSGDIMGALGGVVSWVIDMVTVFNTIHDKRIEKSIQGHARNIKDLQASYEELERVVDRALGGDRYSSQKNAIGNLKQQQAELSAQADEERSKKKSDPDKIRELDKAVKDNANQIADIIDGMRKDILGLDAASAADQLGNAFIDAFSNGEDAAAAWGATVDDIVGNIMKKMLIQKLLEQPMGKILDKYSQKWYDDDENFAGFDTVISDAGKMGDEIKGLGSGFADAIENLPDEIKKYFIGSKTEDADTSLTGAVKGVSEETASIVAGQMNAIRINQMEATSILRQQLMHLSTIAHNTSYNRHLESIDKKLDGLNGSDPLRSKGFS